MGHVDTYHVNNPISSETCNAEFESSCSLSDLKYHPDNLSVVKPTSSKYCPETFNNIHNFKISTNDKLFRCEYCRKAFNQRSTLNTHIRIHTNERPFICEYCKKAFCQSSSLIKHVRIHTNEKPYSCEHCEKAFSSSSALKQHTQVHTNIRIHSCEYCKKAYRKSSDLRRHLLGCIRKVVYLTKLKENISSREASDI